LSAIRFGLLGFVVRGRELDPAIRGGRDLESLIGGDAAVS
jgi:hypothetical protein